MTYWTEKELELLIQTVTYMLVKAISLVSQLIRTAKKAMESVFFVTMV